MKNYYNVILLLFLIVLLSSCFTSDDDLIKAKKNLWIIESDKSKIDSIDTSIVNISDNKSSIDIEDLQKWWIEEIDNLDYNQEIKEKIVKTIEINSLTNEQFLELDDMSSFNLLSRKITITWKTLSSVDKITVHFSNDSSSFPNDSFTLKKFKKWDSIFLYRAFSKYETMDFWKNKYIFEAYSWDKVSKLELIFNVFKQKIEEKKIDFSKFPTNEKYWDIIDLWYLKKWYSNIKWLEIIDDNNPDLKCDSVTNILAEKINSWFFWNTCRPLKWDKWISFYTIRLDWDIYIYEKNYYLDYIWLYITQLLETWTWVTNINISLKNTKLKEKNKDYKILEIVDELINKF